MFAGKLKSSAIYNLSHFAIWFYILLGNYQNNIKKEQRNIFLLITEIRSLFESVAVYRRTSKLSEEVM